MRPPTEVEVDEHSYTQVVDGDRGRHHFHPFAGLPSSGPAINIGTAAAELEPARRCCNAAAATPARACVAARRRPARRVEIESARHNAGNTDSAGGYGAG